MEMLTWWSYWAELAKYILPRRYRWLVVANQMSKGVRINDAIVDSTTTMVYAGVWFWHVVRPGHLRPGYGLLALDCRGSIWTPRVRRARTLSGADVCSGGLQLYDIMAQAFQDVATFGARRRLSSTTLWRTSSAATCRVGESLPVGGIAVVGGHAVS